MEQALSAEYGVIVERLIAADPVGAALVLAAPADKPSRPLLRVQASPAQRSRTAFVARVNLVGAVSGPGVSGVLMLNRVTAGTLARLTLRHAAATEQSAGELRRIAAAFLDELAERAEARADAA